jgi:hypothetical protein
MTGSSVIDVHVVGVNARRKGVCDDKSGGRPNGDQAAPSAETRMADRFASR